MMNRYRLPNGDTTRSGLKYVKAWRKTASPVTEFMREFSHGATWRLVAFDPDLRFLCDERVTDVSIPVALAMGLALEELNRRRYGKA